MRNKKFAGIILTMVLCANGSNCIFAQTDMVPEDSTVRLETEKSEKTDGSETEESENDSEKDSNGTKGSDIESSESESKVQEGERTATIMVVSIAGNELTYYEIEEEEASEEEDASKKEDTSEEEDASEGEDASSNMRRKGNWGNGSVPSQMPEDISNNFEKSGRGAMPGAAGQMADNRKTVYLPVPVVVHTDTDEKMTFSILEAGDKLEVTIVTDEEGNETITEIWMLSDNEDS